MSTELKTTWDFVEKYYPDYYGDALIDYSNVLTCFVNDEPTNAETLEEAICYFDDNFFSPNGDSKELINNRDVYLPIAEKALAHIDGIIYEKAIEEFIKQNK